MLDSQYLTPYIWKNRLLALILQIENITCTIDGIILKLNIIVMKVSIAVIKLVLRTNKVLADGSFPIMLRCSFNGMKERSTGYSCTLKHWDKKNECVKKGYPNFVMVNAELKKLKDEAIRKRDAYIASNEVYTPQMILAREEVRNAVTNDFRGLIQRYIDEKGLEDRTIEKWNIVKRSVIKYVGRNDLLINEVNEAFCRKYCRWLENEKKLSSGSIKSYMGKVVALLHYAVSLGLIDKYPLDGWKYHLDYRESKSEKYIHSKSMEFLMAMFFDEVIVRNGNRWKYKDGAVDKLLDIHSELYALYLFCIGFYFKGLAPTDISMLKKKDIKVIMVKDKNYYAIDGHRSKTGIQYRIRLHQNCVESNVLVRTMLMYNDGEYFLPTLQGFSGDLKKRVNNLYTYHGGNLVKWFQRCNEIIVKHNVEEEDNVPLIDLDVRFYGYRHTYIMSEIQKPNVNLLKIATETGKSVTTLHQYLTLLQDIDLVE